MKINISQYRLRAYHDAVEHFFGVACPVLSGLSLLHYAEMIQWAWLFLLWLSCGHYSLYFYNVFPVIKYRPFVKGLFVFGVGLLWPVWCAAHANKRKLRH